MTERLRCWVEISRSRLAENYHAIRRLVGPGCEVMPVVKADAYRHGAAEVSRVLVGEGVRWLAVSSVDEGIALRQAGIGVRILVMGGVLPWEVAALREFELTPAIHSLDELKELGSVPFHLKIDSGMGRLGVRECAESIIAALQAGDPRNFEGLMTHLASSADFASPQTEQQIAEFEETLRKLREAGLEPRHVHLASTNPVLLGRRECWRSMVRPGIALYGYYTPAKGVAVQPLVAVKPVLEWKASIVAIKDVERGAALGYGAMYRAQQDMRIAVLGLGYADGLPHRLSNKGKVIAGGKFCPIVGAVSMDLTTVDVSHTPDLQPGHAVAIIGSEGGVTQDATQLARSAGTISYSVLCGISARVKRVYR